jgi:nitrogen regulatory protein PII
MRTEARTLVTIVTEAALERRITDDIRRLGAHGYTVSDARGEGSRGVRSAGWDATSNIRIEVVCDDRTAEAIAAHLRAHYYDHYAMILFMSAVGVLRPEKF